MTQEQAFAFIGALNRMQEYVPPNIFSQIINSYVAGMVTAVANNRAVCELKPMPEPSQATTTAENPP